MMMLIIIIIGIVIIIINDQGDKWWGAATIAAVCLPGLLGDTIFFVIDMVHLASVGIIHHGCAYLIISWHHLAKINQTTVYFYQHVPTAAV